MAISEICKFEVKKEIDAYTAKGMSRNEASKWLAGVFSDALGKTISHETIRTKDKTARKEVGLNRPTKSKVIENTTNYEPPKIIKDRKPPGGGGRIGLNKPTKSKVIENTTNYEPPKIIKDRKPPGGGRRKGAGRPVSQKTAWRNALSRLKKVVDYMLLNCETPADIDREVISEIKMHIDTLRVFKSAM